MNDQRSLQIVSGQRRAPSVAIWLSIIFVWLVPQYGKRIYAKSISLRGNERGHKLGLISLLVDVLRRTQKKNCQSKYGLIFSQRKMSATQNFKDNFELIVKYIDRQEMFLVLSDFTATVSVQIRNFACNLCSYYFVVKHSTLTENIGLGRKQTETNYKFLNFYDFLFRMSLGLCLNFELINFTNQMDKT